MTKPTSNFDELSDCISAGRVEPDFSGLDSAADILRDADKFGLLDELRKHLGMENRDNGADKLRIARDIAYEFAGEKDRDLAVDLFIHVTGIAEFGPASLRDYGRKHGCTHEWFRRKAEAMRKRLDLPLLPSQRDEAIRAEHRLVNRRNDAA